MRQLRSGSRVRRSVARCIEGSAIVAFVAVVWSGCGVPPEPIIVAQDEPEACNYVPSSDGACPEGLVRCYVQGAVLCIAPEQQEACCETVARTSAR